jgi:hypothetical protein
MSRRALAQCKNFASCPDKAYADIELAERATRVSTGCLSSLQIIEYSDFFQTCLSELALFDKVTAKVQLT